MDINNQQQFPSVNDRYKKENYLVTLLASKTDETKHNWQTTEVLDLFKLPFNDLIHQAQIIHRQHFDANKVQIATLLSGRLQILSTERAPRYRT